MATLTITNISAEDVCINDLYKTLAPGEVVTCSRAPSDLPGMAGLQAALADGLVTLSVVYTADELASGLIAPPASIAAVDMAPVAAADPAAGLITIRKAFTALGPGVPDDVTIYAANALPFKFRVLEAFAYIVTAIALTTIEVRSRAGGLGTLAGTVSSAATGYAQGDAPSNATVALTPGTLEGLFLRRSDRGVAGEVVIIGRIES